MTCNSCGATVETGTVFCHLCGAPVGAAPSAVGEPASAGPLRLSLEASALGLFGRSLLMALSFPFVIPVPWVISWFTGWLAGEVRASNGENFRFSGTAANVWKIIALYVLVYAVSFGTGLARDENDGPFWVYFPSLLSHLVMLALGWMFTRWTINHLELNGRHWRFDGSVWGFIGWNLLVSVSILTIIGWAWAIAGFYDWVASHVRDAGGDLRFLGAGHQVLWRTIVLVPFCIPIVTIPWALKWYYDWLVSQVELTPESGNVEASRTPAAQGISS